MRCIVGAVLGLATLCAHADVMSAINDIENGQAAHLENEKVSEEAMNAFPINDKDRVKYTEALNTKAQGLFREQKVEEALAVWERITVIDPKNAQNIANVALTYKDLGREDEAYATMQKALEVAPNAGMTHYHLSTMAKSPDDAIKFLSRACELEPNAMQYGLVSHLGAFLMNAQRFDEAKETFKKIFDAKLETVPDLINYGDMMVQLGHRKKAVRVFKKLLKELDNPTGSTKELPEHMIKDFKTKANLALSKMVTKSQITEVGADGSTSSIDAAAVGGENEHETTDLTAGEDEGEDEGEGEGEGEGEEEGGTSDALKFAQAAVKLQPQDVSARLTLARMLEQHAPEADRETAAAAAYDKALALAKVELGPLLEKYKDEEGGLEAATQNEKVKIRALAIELAQRRSYARAENRRIQQGQAPDLYTDESGFMVRSSAASGWRGRRASATALGPGTCSIPRRDATTLSVTEFHEQYVDAGKPVLLYGPGVVAGAVWQKWTKAGLLAAYGETNVLAVNSAAVVADQTHSGSLTASTTLNITLAEYVTNFTGHADEVAFDNPPYLFKQSQIPGVSGDIERPKYFEPLPQADADTAADVGDGSSTRFSWSAEKRANASLFFVGPTHSGAYFHAHFAAWNAVVYGRKRWLLMPPGAYYGQVHNGNTTVIQWIERNLDKYKPLDCVQEAGTMLFVPEGWAHATINLDDTIGIAIEVGPALSSFK